MHVVVLGGAYYWSEFPVEKEAELLGDYQVIELVALGETTVEPEDVIEEIKPEPIVEPMKQVEEPPVLEEADPTQPAEPEPIVEEVLNIPETADVDAVHFPSVPPAKPQEPVLEEKPIVKPVEIKKPQQVSEVPKQQKPDKPKIKPVAKSANIGAQQAYTPPTKAIGLNNKKPAYSSYARKRQMEGTVVLLLSIDPTGKVVAIEIIKSSGYKVLDKAAMLAAENWQYKPATKGNIPIASSLKVPVEFRLNRG